MKTRLFQRLLLPGRNWLGRRPFCVERSPQILRSQKHLRHNPQTRDRLVTRILHGQSEFLGFLPEFSADDCNWAGTGSGRRNGVNRHHPRLHVILHVTVKHPCPGIIGNHVDRLHAAGKEFDHVGIPAALGNRFPVPVRRVQVDFISHPE